MVSILDNPATITRPIEPPGPPQGVFGDGGGLFHIYRVEVTFRDKLMGGTPKDRKIIQSWLGVKTGLTDDTTELRRAALRTAVELGYTQEDVDGLSLDQIEELMAGVTGDKQTVGFKRDANGLFIESRQLKAMLKEEVNILYPYQREKWGPTKKAPRSFFAERVFVEPDRIYLGRQKPDDVELFIGHTPSPQGPQSNLTYYEYVQQAVITFEVQVTDNEIPVHAWPRLWVHAQQNGIGALRSQGFGKFLVTGWEKV